MPRVDRKTHGVSQEKYPSNLRESRNEMDTESERRMESRVSFSPTFS